LHYKLAANKCHKGAFFQADSSCPRSHVTLCSRSRLLQGRLPSYRELGERVPLLVRRLRHRHRGRPDHRVRHGEQVLAWHRTYGSRPSSCLEGDFLLGDSRALCCAAWPPSLLSQCGLLHGASCAYCGAASSCPILFSAKVANWVHASDLCPSLLPQCLPPVATLLAGLFGSIW